MQKPQPRRNASGKQAPMPLRPFHQPLSAEVPQASPAHESRQRSRQEQRRAASPASTLCQRPPPAYSKTSSEAMHREQRRHEAGKVEATQARQVVERDTQSRRVQEACRSSVAAVGKAEMSAVFACGARRCGVAAAMPIALPNRYVL